MIPLRHGARIVATVLRYRLDTILVGRNDDHWSRWLLPGKWLPNPSTTSAARLRLALEHLGPVFVKLGQILSTRRDLLPDDYADELAKLQDRVPPFPSAQAIERVEAELGDKVSVLFATFTSEPLASASLAQVHAATRKDGERIVVKVIRPDIERTITNDLKLIRSIARSLERISKDARRLRLTTVVDDYERTIFGELDLLQEAANTAQLRRNFAKSPLLYAPKVHWDLTTRNVLVVEHVDGVPIADVQTLLARGTNMQKLAERGVETFFTQVFKHNFFHADMHPGNIFVDITDPDDPSYIAIDCAIIGQLTKEDQAYLARNIVAFFRQDYAQIARLHLESGWIPDATDVGDFEAVIRELCEPLFQKPLAEISFGHFLIALFTTARRFDLEVQPQLVLLQKTLLNIEGLGRQLYPELDLWTTAQPFMEEWMQERYGPAAMLREFLDQAPAILEELPRLPDLLVTAVKTLPQLDGFAREQKRAMSQLTQVLEREQKRNHRRRVAGALCIVGGLALLWEPLVSAIWSEPGGLSVSAGLAATVIGALLVGRG